MTYSEANLAVRKRLAKYSNTDENDWYLCLKARYGMATVFHAIFDLYGSKSEVITTPYTCITSVNPILVSHLKPIYADINPENLSITKPKHLISKNTRAIVVQHTLGIINKEINEISKTCNEHDLLLVEDSAHCLARMALNSKKEPIADISIHSFGVEKVLQDTKFGGAIYVNPALKHKNPKLYAKITTDLINLPEVPRSLDLKIKAYRTENAILQRLPNRFKGSFRDLLLKTNIYEPAVVPMEQKGKQSKPYAITDYVSETILKHLPSLSSTYNRRTQNVALYQKYLKKAKNFHIISMDDQPMLAFPIVFEEIRHATDAYNALTASGYFIRRWYSPLLYPGPSDTRSYYYNSKMAPVAEAMHPRVICLPTNLSVTDTKKIIAILSPVENPVQNLWKTLEK